MKHFVTYQMERKETVKKSWPLFLSFLLDTSENLL